VLDMIRKIEARGALDISRRAKQGVVQVFQFAIGGHRTTPRPIEVTQLQYVGRGY